MKHKARRLLSCFMALCLILMSTPFPSLAVESSSDPSSSIYRDPVNSDTIQMTVGDVLTFSVGSGYYNYDWTPSPEWTSSPGDKIQLTYRDTKNKNAVQVKAIAAAEIVRLSVIVTPEKNGPKEPPIVWSIKIVNPEKVTGTKVSIKNLSTDNVNKGNSSANPFIIYPNDSFTLSAEVTDNNGTPASDQSVTWTPDSLDMNGAPPFTSVVIKAPELAANEPSRDFQIQAESTAYKNVRSNIYHVQVRKRPTLSLKYTSSTKPLEEYETPISLGQGHSFTFDVETNRADNSISFTTDKDGIVDVKQTERKITVTGRTKGEVKVSVSVENVSVSFKIYVYIPATSLDMSPDEKILTKNKTIPLRLEMKKNTPSQDERILLKPECYPLGADLEFTVINGSGSVRVTNDGWVTPKARGLCEVEVKSKTDTLEGTTGGGSPPLSFKYSVNVVKPAVGISIGTSERSVAVDRTIDLTAIATDKETTDENERTITWTVVQDKDDQIVGWDVTQPDDATTGAKVCRITGIKPGKVTVIATTANGISGEYTITVAVPIQEIEIVAEDGKNPVIKNRATEIMVGDSFLLDVNFTPNTVTAPISWHSVSPSIASIDNGLLIAKNTGKTTISATVPTINNNGEPVEKKYELTVTVKPRPVDTVTMEGLANKPGGKDNEFIATVGMDAKLPLRDHLVVSPANATNPNVTWTSDNESVAPVKNNGIVTPLKVGTATITATSNADKNKFVTVTVTVTASTPTGILLSPNDPVTLEVNQSQTFTATLTPPGSDGTVTFGLGTGGSDILNHTWPTNNNNKIFTATGKKPGETTVAVKLGENLNASVKVTVSGVVIDDNRLVNNALAVATGTSTSVTKKLYGSAKTLNAKDWAWSSDNETVVRVNESSGLITGIKPGTAKVTCKNKNYSATFTVNVSESSATVISYKITEGKLYNFASKTLGDIRDQCKKAFDGSDLDYVTNLSVPPSQGTLYYGYVSENNPGQGVAAGDRFYYKLSATGAARPEDDVRYATGKPLDKLFADVTFVPATGFSGTAGISYTAVAENGKELAGTIQITVPVPSELTYSSPNGEAVRFHTNDFSTLSQTTSGYPISSVRFNAPSERYGYLYYEYAGGDVYGSNITSGQRFYASSTPSLDSVVFVPRAGYTGTFPITFTGWNTNGASFTGTIRITVRTTEEGGGDISYNTLSGSRVYFDAIDFQDLCRTATGGKLNYIQFTTLPSVEGSSSSSSAVLYHGSGSGSRVSTSSSLYASSSGSRWTIDNVYLLPSSSFTGSVTIPFKGWDTDRKSFEGTVVVHVTKDGGTAATIYMTCTGMPLVFRRADFDDACKDALPALLKSVRFNLPGSNSGTLYSRFNDLNDRQCLAANQDIPAADLVTLSYLPKGETSGTVYLSYTATDEKDNICTGQVRITIDPNPVSQYFVDLNNTVWAIPSINFLRSYGVVAGKGKKRYQPNDTLKRGDFVLMLARAFNFPLNGTESFPDVPRNSYYAGAIAAGKSMNLIKGSGKNGSFRPEDNITRQEAATILFRVLQSQQNLSSADTGYLTSFSDMGQIQSYAQTALATLVRDGIFEGSGGQLYPYAPLTRAQMAVILHRAIT